VIDGAACKICLYFQPASLEGSNGFCHRYPPVFLRYNVFSDPDEDRFNPVTDTGTFFPEVENDQWCGEFRKEWSSKFAASGK
jgi:hypothetical protein